VVDMPLSLDGERAIHRRPPPRLGEHTAAILEELGVTAKEMDGLVRERVVSC
jgi:crotonobetainyl-CoA:carnitine CoA-transferase CaiB-like acyl-CoA transferase